MCAGTAHSEAEKTTGQRRDEEGLLQRVRNPHTPAHEVRRFGGLSLSCSRRAYTEATSACTRLRSARSAEFTPVKR